MVEHKENIQQQIDIQKEEREEKNILKNPNNEQTIIITDSSNIGVAE
jgi:hypothetical protein